MKKITLLIVLISFTCLSVAQYQWVRASVINGDNLQTAFIDENGSIFVFGDNAFGAVSDDDGENWKILEGIDSSSRDIISSMKIGNDIYVIGNNKLKKYNLINSYWIDFSLYLNGDVESMGKDHLNNNYFFPVYSGLASRMQGSKLYNFYLPMVSDHPNAEQWRYQSALADKGRIISCLHYTSVNHNGMLAHVFVSDDNGTNWKKVNYSFPGLSYVKGIHFRGNIGFIVGSNGAGGGIYLYKTEDNGDSWQVISQFFSVEEWPSSASVYTDNNSLGIVVGSIWREDKKIGMIKIENEPIITWPEKLNFITGNEEKIVIVGDNGEVLIGRKTPSLNISPKDGDFMAFLLENQIVVKSSEIIKELSLLDISGRCLKTFWPNEVNSVINATELPPGALFIYAD